LGIAERAVALLSELEGARDYARLRLVVASLLLAMDPPDVRRAGDFLRRCAGDLQDMGSPADLVPWHALMSQILLFEGDVEEAALRARQAVDLASVKALPAPLRAMALVALSDVLMAQGRDCSEPLLCALSD